MTDPIESAIFDRLAAAGPGRSICPSEVARELEPEQWRRMLPRVRAVAIGLMRQGRLVIVKKGKPVNPEALKGVIRLRLPAAEPGAE